MTNKAIQFKEPSLVCEWLDTALAKEKEKYQKCPVIHDTVPEHESAQAWAYVVAGYFLLEEAFKVLLHIRGDQQVPTTHSLSTLFEKMDDGDKETLSKYYTDFKFSNDNGLGLFPFENLRVFLTNLDGSRNQHGNHIGSFEWRYFLIEEQQSPKMPIVSIEYMHEVVSGCIRIIKHAITGCFEPSQYTSSKEMRGKRINTYLTKWLPTRINTNEWKNQNDTLEILWGPDYQGCYDLLFPKHRRFDFGAIPENCDLPIVDLREDIKRFLEK